MNKAKMLKETKAVYSMLCRGKKPVMMDDYNSVITYEILMRGKFSSLKRGEKANIFISVRGYSEDTDEIYKLGSLVKNKFTPDPFFWSSLKANGLDMSLEPINRKALEIIDIAKRPDTNKNYIGVELEFISPFNKTKIMTKLAKAKLEHKVNLGYDGSVECPYTGDDGYELRVLDKQSNIKTTLTKVLKVLKESEASVTEECGLHVHLDMRNRDKGSSYSKLYKALPTLAKMVHPSRLKNDYCEMNESSESGGKYEAINSMTAFNTIEVRLHEGTLDKKKIHKWISTLTSIVDKGTINKETKKVG